MKVIETGGNCYYWPGEGSGAVSLLIVSLVGSGLENR